MLQRIVGSRAARLGFVAVALVLCALALVRYWSQITDAAVDLDPWAVAAALGLGFTGTGFALVAWRRMLAELGSPLPGPAAVRVFSLSQLGKYIPGSIWPFVAQIELGREHGVPRQRSAAALLLVIGVSIVTACLTAALTLPFAAGQAARAYWWGLVPAPLLLALLHPAALNRVLDRALKIVRRPALERPLSGRGIVAVAGWCAASWIAFGTHVWVLARDLGGTGGALLPAAIGAYALAWTAGFLFVIAPAGAGVREVVLAAGLASSLAAGPVVLLVIASRLLLTVGDLLWAGIGVLLGRAHVAHDPDELAEAERLRRAALGEPAA